MSWYNVVPFNTLLGKTLTEVSVDALNESITFTTSDGKKYKQYHERDCCERVFIESIVGDIEDLVGYPITLAEEATSRENPVNARPDVIEHQESFTWTFYKLATVKGYVDIRWYGESNGYYGESVDLYEDW